VIEKMHRRLTWVKAVLIVLAGLIVYRLISLQFGLHTAYFTNMARSEYLYSVTVRSPRGEIYDRDGVLLSANLLEYEIGMSPVLISDREGTADAIASVMDLPREELLEEMSSPEPYILLMRPAPARIGQTLMALNLDGLVVTPIHRRYYPQAVLAAQVLGFVGYDDVGYYGVEGFYDDLLTGTSNTGGQSRIPFEVTMDRPLRPSTTLHLTLDCEIQYLAESTLDEALRQTGAERGTITILQPRTGEILAMASRPTFDPNSYFNEPDERVFINPIISEQFEPGSIFKVLTMAIALENGVVEPDSTYEDNGVIEVGGQEIYNWDRAAHGTTTMVDLLGLSLNVGAATLSLRTGPIDFYAGLDQFGIGQLTGIDLQGEASGSFRRPGNADWHESDLATNAFGQGLAVTPLQMIMAVGAVANDGLLMQPHVVYQRVESDGTVTTAEPTVLGRAVSAQTAHDLTDMLATALEREASSALVPGYRIAGKTGTAEIPIPGGYDPEGTIASFVGYGPADDPQFVVLIVLYRPTSSRWGSQTAAPVFSQLVSELVVLMEIPPDDVRLEMAP
jgi:cell division protein FtsI/penicillin-binding protein 2